MAYKEKNNSGNKIVENISLKCDTKIITTDQATDNKGLTDYA